MPCSLSGLRGCGDDAHHFLLNPVPDDTSNLKQAREKIKDTLQIVIHDTGNYRPGFGLSGWARGTE